MHDDQMVAGVKARSAEDRGRPGSRLPVLPRPATDHAVEEAERVVGVALPPLLRRLYREIADGGFGPFNGVYSVAALVAENPPGLYVAPGPAGRPGLPGGVLFFCDFGCAMWALLDCRHPLGRMWWWDQGARYKLDLTLPEWFGAWLAGDDLTRLWATPSLRLVDESWTPELERQHRLERPEREAQRVVPHPDQLSLW